MFNNKKQIINGFVATGFADCDAPLDRISETSSVLFSRDARSEEE